MKETLLLYLETEHKEASDKSDQLKLQLKELETAIRFLNLKLITIERMDRFVRNLPDEHK